MLAGRNEAALAAAVKAAGGGNAAYIVADVSKPEDNDRLIKAAEQKFGGIDAFVANAGVEGATASIVDYPVDAFDQVMAINVRGVFLGLKHAIPALKKRGGGSIIITSSIGGIKARGQGNSAYVASKHAEIGLMRTASAECAPFNIRVNCVLPGPTDTRMMRNIEEGRSPGAPEKTRDAILAGLPLKRYGTAEEIARLMLFLVSDESSICTGGIYAADGGLSAI
jgi:NAD(P)-dependent dehydrogenase (short-subunit alcohol dehydrogenase family)